MKKLYVSLLLVSAVAVCVVCLSASTSAQPNPEETGLPKIEAWVTNANRSMLFQQEAEPISFSEKREGRGGTPIIVDDNQVFQTMDGFGFAMTGGSAEHLIKMSKGERGKILREMFAADGNNVGFSYIRLTLGASDLNSFVFSYDDLPEGMTEDFELKHFSLSQDLKDVVPVMKEVLKINPDILIMASPWSAPVWMKESKNVRGGKLRKDCYAVYAAYFVKYVEAMAKHGIHIDAVTIQNEPLNSRNTPSMPWAATDQLEFVKDHLGPAFKRAGLDTKIVTFDHNCDRPDFPLAILADPEAAQYVDGSAFHHYAGDMSAMTYVHDARPDKHIYFTEQMTTERPGSQMINIVQSVKRLIVDVPRNWSRNVILWNVAADPLNDPHTDNGGCSMCQGAITIDGDKVTRNIAYYTVAHASKFVRPGSVRIASTNRGDRVMGLFEDEQRPGVFRAEAIANADVLPNVAFKTPDGKTVLIVANDSYNKTSFTIQHKGMYAEVSLRPGSVGTYVW
jgi:glucosylceramidase